MSYPARNGGILPLDLFVEKSYNISGCALFFSAFPCSATEVYFCCMGLEMMIL